MKMNKLYIVSCGAGGLDYLTTEALDAIKESEVVVSYSKYARELGSIVEGKELCTSGMTFEVQRCVQAIEYVKQGKTTCIMSNGDANVFGTASIVVELLDKDDLWDEIELVSIAGVTAFLAAASKVGAPISQDFAVISLTDKLNKIDLISKRVKLALDGDFVLGLYSPKTRLHFEPFVRFLEILKNYDERVVIIASNIGRKNKEKITITNTTKLIKAGLENELITMSTLIIIGNSTTHLTKNGLVLTPRKS